MAATKKIQIVKIVSFYRGLFFQFPLPELSQSFPLVTRPPSKKQPDFDSSTMGLNKFGIFITVFLYAMFISQAFCARVRLLDLDNVLTTEPGHDDLVLLPQQNIQVSPLATGYRSPDSDKNVGKVLLRLPGKQGPYYPPLVLNLLPKGRLPPSGPSKRTNNFS
ncbi:hypothetical protein REPUB_Repub15cG0144000 [Reevesia pubescens]